MRSARHGGRRSEKPEFVQLCVPITREDVRRAALHVLANPPTTELAIWARVLRSAARAQATIDPETAVAIQEQAQRMGPTPEGERTLARMRAELRGEIPEPMSAEDDLAQLRELEQLKRGSRRRPENQSEATMITLTDEPKLTPAQPFLRWAGGKRRLLPTIKAHLPRAYEGFLEPFIGGGAVYFGVRPRCALITDTNLRLIRTYRGVRDDVESVIRYLKNYTNEEATYREIRDSDRLDASSDAEAAATFVYLNQTCFNGLYRVNARDRFNVPFGHRKRAVVCDAASLRACSVALRGTSIEHLPFEAALAMAQPGDVAYCDPPYLPGKGTEFVDYTATGFGDAEHVRLRDLALDATQRGVQVLISNSDTPRVRALYADPVFRVIPITTTRSISADPKGRGKAGEVLIANYRQ